MSIVPPNYRNPVYHFRGPSTFPSPYSMTDAALQNYGVTRALFGSTTIILSATQNFNVKDYQYAVATNNNGDVTAVGMYFLPVSDNSFVPNTNGQPVAGSQVVDDFIRAKQNLQPNDDIYALISYMHPELSSGTIPYLATTDKATLGFTHMGAYLGLGITSNAPVQYHNHRFGCYWGGVLGNTYGYPCNIHLVSLTGVDQATLNRNCQLVDMLVGHGLEFPGAYQNSMFRPVFINAALMFYRDWLFQEDYLINDQTWYFYCAANKLTVLNIALNLPHNEAAFKEVYGEVAGAALWAQFLVRYTNVTGFDFYYYPNQETSFNPLWKLEGLTASQIVPFTIQQYNAYDSWRRTRSPYNGPMPVDPPKGVVCDAQSTADILYEFVQIYGDAYDAGPFTTAGILWGWMPIILQRTGLPELLYLKYALPMMQKLAFMLARLGAATNPSPTWGASAWFWTTYSTFVALFGGTASAKPSVQNEQEVQDLINKNVSADDLAERIVSETPDDDPTPEELAVFTMLNVSENWAQIMAGGIWTNDNAYNEFMASAKTTFDDAEKVVITDPNKIQYNILPAAFNVISNGLYDNNPLVTIQTVATAVDISELQLPS